MDLPTAQRMTDSQQDPATTSAASHDAAADAVTGVAAPGASTDSLPGEPSWKSYSRAFSPC